MEPFPQKVGPPEAELDADSWWRDQSWRRSRLSLILAGSVCGLSSGWLFRSFVDHDPRRYDYDRAPDRGLVLARGRLVDRTRKAVGPR